MALRRVVGGGRRAFTTLSSPFSSSPCTPPRPSLLKSATPSSSFHTLTQSPIILSSSKKANTTFLLHSVRQFSSSTPPPGTTPTSNDAASTVAIEDAQSIVEREHFGKVRSRLESDPRKKISYHEYEKICTEQGLTKGQAKQLAQSLSDAGIILYFGNSSNAVLRDFIYLKPVEFNKTVSKILAQLSDDTYLKDQLGIKTAELEQLKKELEPMDEKRAQLERKAHRTATTYLWLGFGYCVVQAVIVARLTWWELSWDVMEPVTYMLTFATVLIGYSYFVLTGSEYTFEGLRKTLEKRKLAKLIRKQNFDEKTYEKLQQALQVRRDEVQRLLEDIEHDPVSLHLKDPSKPVV